MNDVNDQSDSTMSATGAPEANPGMQATDTGSPADAGASQATPADGATATAPGQSEPRSAEAILDKLNPQPAESAVQPPKSPADAPQTPAQPQAPAIAPELLARLSDPEEAKRLLNLDKLYGRQAQEVGQLRKQMTEFEQHRQQWEQQKAQQAKTQNLKPWNRDHPDHGRFRSMRDGVRAKLELAKSLPTEMQEAAMRAAWQGVRPEDQQALQEHQAWQEQERNMAPEEREDRYREIIRSEFTNLRQQWEAEIQQKQTAEQFMQQNQEFIQKYPAEMQRLMEHPNKRDLAVALLGMREELQALKAQNGQNVRTVATAEAQRQANASRATTSRDASTVPAQTGVRQAVAQGKKFDSDSLFAAVLAQHQS